MGGGTRTKVTVDEDTQVTDGVDLFNGRPGDRNIGDQRGTIETTREQNCPHQN